MAEYVLIHGAWHTGNELEPVANVIRAEGHHVHTPTVRGNRPGDPKTTGLSEAIESIVEYLEEKDANDIILVGHSYGGMVITGVVDRIPHRVHRLVYWNAFVPNDGEALIDMTIPSFAPAMEALAAERGDGSVVLPFGVWRETLINDADLATAKSAYDTLNPHPILTFKEKISLSKNPIDLALGKSFVNGTEDISMPHSHPWHPRLSEKLGLFRLIQVRGSHELCFSNPERLARAIIDAGRD
jgi:pimeloyl-ACP methyl ester carboxylesterase